MTQTRTWASGDRLMHTGKPEWGHGVVSSATKTTQDGHPCQLLTIRFARAGVKSISTAFASLVPAEQGEALPSYETTQSDAPTSERSGSKFRIHDDAGKSAIEDKLSGAADIRERMTRLPEAATDPFSSSGARLKATLGLFRFNAQGGSLLDWAAMQSGLADPMSRFNRHELERFFEAFVVVRDSHFKKIAQEVRKADPSALQQALAQAPAGAQQTLRRLDALR